MRNKLKDTPSGPARVCHKYHSNENEIELKTASTVDRRWPKQSGVNRICNLDDLYQLYRFYLSLTEPAEAREEKKKEKKKN